MENTNRWFRWFVLFILLSTVLAWLLLINQTFAMGPKPDCNALPGVLCPNPQVMFAPTPLASPTATPFSSIWGDAGDAPDGRLSPMTAYPTSTVAANFPTIYVPGLQSGPYHFYPETGAYLGQAVSQEVNAHQFPDDDGRVNIDPALDRADEDDQDDGLGRIDELQYPCTAVSIPYTVTVEAPNTIFYLNIWFDFNRDGQWGDSDTCENMPVEEWAVQNHILGPVLTPGLITGTISVMTTNFEDDPLFDPLWARVTLSEQPATMSDGSGPPAGFLYGETEDYLLCWRIIYHGSCINPKHPQFPVAGWLG